MCPGTGLPLSPAASRGLTQTPRETSPAGEEKACQRPDKLEKQGRQHGLFPVLLQCWRAQATRKAELVENKPAQRKAETPTGFKADHPAAQKWKEGQEKQGGCQKSVPREGVWLDESCLLKDNDAVADSEHKTDLSCNKKIKEQSHQCLPQPLRALRTELKGKPI